MGLIIDSPQPLRNCPTLSMWRKRSGDIYLFFVDETYLQFFELNSRGYFCQGGVGIPENDYEVIKTELAPAFERYRDGNTVPPPPISLQEPGRFRVFLGDVREVSERWQLPPVERVSPRSRAPSTG